MLNSEPQRVQLRRTKGWRMPPNTVKVDRSTRWGNHYRVGGPIWRNKGFGKVKDTAEAVDAFRRLVVPHMIDIAQLRGKNLACWCKSGEPCHADVLLEVANRALARSQNTPDSQGDE